MSREEPGLCVSSLSDRGLQKVRMRPRPSSPKRKQWFAERLVEGLNWTDDVGINQLSLSLSRGILALTVADAMGKGTSGVFLPSPWVAELMSMLYRLCSNVLAHGAISSRFCKPHRQVAIMASTDRFTFFQTFRCLIASVSDVMRLTPLELHFPISLGANAGLVARVADSGVY